ncbi:MAG TPA: hypothetical protein VF166_05075 [Gemmatimonadaceae bacterium]
MSPRTSLPCALVLTALLGIPTLVRAQAVLGIGDDATTLPGGGFRLSVSNAWSRYDARYDAAGNPRPLAPDLTAPDAGVAQFENLAPLQQHVRALSGLSSFDVSIGQTALDENALVRTTPIRAELGVTHWLQLGVMVPVVRTQTNVAFRVNSAGPAGNVGVNPGLAPGAAADANAALQQQFTSAAAALGAKIDACTANPSGTDCANVLANGPSLLASAQGFASGLAQVYDSSFFVPLAGTDADNAIRARVATFSSTFAGFGITDITSTGPSASQAPAGVGDVQRFVTDPAFGIAADSIQTVSRLGLGDIELSAKVQWLNTVGQADRFHVRRGVNVRSAVTGVVRLGTGSPSSPSNFLDIGTGDGQTDVEVRSQNDIVLGRRFWASVVGSYGIQLADQRIMRIADPEQPIAGAYRTFNVQRDLGDYYSIAFTPRLVIDDYFSLGAQYLYWHKAQDRYSGTFTTTNFVGDTVTLDASILDRETAQHEQRISVGLLYSTLAAYAAGKTWLPLEVSFEHTNAIAGSGGRTPKISDTTLRIRLYARLFGGPMWGRP